MLEFGNDNMLIDSPAPFLVKLVEERDNCLKILIALSRTDEIEIDTELVEYKKIKELLTDVKSIEPDKENLYEILFENYILHQTRNESYCSLDKPEVHCGKYFLIYEKSKLLDILPQITDCQITSDGYAYPGIWKHYGINCQNHIIDIISCEEPVIRKII